MLAMKLVRLIERHDFAVAVGLMADRQASERSKVR